ncbi:MAG: polysaccharide biosynthesis C-terminal domain-containing protein [Bacteroidales bacterium]
MMNENPFKKLGIQTLIYGLGTIVPRLLNYAILTYYYTKKLEVQEYGIITELYAYIALFLVVLTLGLETGYFKFSVDNDKKAVFSNCVLLLFFTNLAFIVGGIIFSKNIAVALQYNDFPVFIRWSVLIVGLDSFVNIFIAKLRIEEKTYKFVFIQLLNIIITVILVLFFLEKLPDLVEKNAESLIFKIFGYKEKVYYIFLANFIASFIRMIIVLSELKNIQLRFNRVLISQILLYSLPLLIAQFSGTINETIDRILLRLFLPEGTDTLYELGIYGANYRIAVLMTLFIQMFRYAADPFYFSNYKKENSKLLYANVFKYFVVFCLIIFLLITLYIDFFKFFIDEKFHSGLHIVPIIVLSSFLTGVLFNLNVWYRLTGKTVFGIYIIGTGAIITVVLNVLLIPVIGYLGCAVTHLASTVCMVLLSYFLSNRYYMIPYDVKKILLYFTIAFVIFIIGYYVRIENNILNTVKNSIMFVLFITYIFKKEKIINTFLE